MRVESRTARIDMTGQIVSSYTEKECRKRLRSISRESEREIDSESRSVVGDQQEEASIQSLGEESSTATFFDENPRVSTNKRRISVTNKGVQQEETTIESLTEESSSAMRFDENPIKSTDKRRISAINKVFLSIKKSHSIFFKKMPKNNKKKPWRRPGKD
jgi:superfamily II DNA/RNA helicase